MAENVRGLLIHDGGRTLRTMTQILEDLGYRIVEPQIVKAIRYRVPQKRERLILIGIRKDLKNTVRFEWPTPEGKIYTVKDALKAGELFDRDVPVSDGQAYQAAKREIMKLVPPGGYWRDLPLEVQKMFMKKSFFSAAVRLAWQGE